MSKCPGNFKSSTYITNYIAYFRYEIKHRRDLSLAAYFAYGMKVSHVLSGTNIIYQHIYIGSVVDSSLNKEYPNRI